MAATSEPTFVDMPVPPGPTNSHRMMLLAYLEWLHHEQILLCHALGIDERVVFHTAAKSFHFPPGGSWQDVPPPSARAIAVMDAAGVDLDAVRTWARRAARTGNPWDGFEPEPPDAPGEAVRP